MIRLYAVNILPLRDEKCFEECYVRSSQERQEKADMLQMPDDKARCIAAGLLLEYAYQKFRIEKTKELAGANSFGYVKNATFPEKLPEVVSGVKGKPQFAFAKEDDCKLYFNLSHSGDFVICAMADFEVGTDVQKRTKVRENLLCRFFSKEERARVEACGKDETLRERVFAQIWAVKEAQTKLTGHGIGQMLGPAGESKKYCIRQGMLGEDYAWAVVSYLEATGGEEEIVVPVVVDEGEMFYEGMF